MNVLENMLSKYNLTTDADVINAMREIMQEIALAGLYRGGFFNKAAFYGGTCLRIFHKIDRFSEDLDFSLLEKNPDFKLEPYFKALAIEFEALGLEVQITQKQKKHNTDIESAFLKPINDIYILNFKNQKNIKIKFEVDTNPPLGFELENRLLLQPFSFYVNCFTLPDLFSGKMHALLFRNWKNRVKGRDWYDFEWYVRNRVKLNLSHFAERAYQTNHLSSNTISKTEFIDMLKERISKVDFNNAAKEVAVFISNPDKINIWSKDYFLQVADMVEYKNE